MGAEFRSALGMAESEAERPEWMKQLPEPRRLDFEAESGPAVNLVEEDEDEPRAVTPEPAAPSEYLHLVPPEGVGSVAVTLGDGRRRYVSLMVDEAEEAAGAAPVRRRPSYAATGSKEASDALFRRVEERRAEEYRAATAHASRRAAGEGSGGGEEGAGGGGDGVKWTDRYAPRHFHELLTPEEVNRNVLKWVRQWDSRVFARAGAGGTAGGVGRSGGFPAGWDASRPILLLAGSAGVGKTVLAHVIARQAGYAVMELNASEDRSARLMGDRLAAAMESRVTAFQGGRPQLVVLDEVDGMDARAVDLLVGMAGRTRPLGDAGEGWAGSSGGAGASSKAGSKRARAAGAGAASDDEEAREGEGGEEEEGGAALQPPRPRRARGGGRLTRPVLCTCNDVFAPALRRLRNVAVVVEVPRPRMDRLVAVLRNVCRSEGLVATHDGLHAVAERCSGDVRACINVLQTSARVLGRDALASSVRLTADVVRALPLGVVDDQRSALDTWETLLCGSATAARKRRAGSGGAGAGTTGRVGVATQLLEDLAARSPDAGLLLDGLLANATRAMDGDVLGVRTAQALEWLALGDVWANVGAHWFASTVRHVSVAAVAASLSARVSLQGRHMRAVWPRELRALESQARASQAVAATVLEGRKGRLGLGARLVRTLVVDVVSPLLDVASPPLDARSVAVLSSRDKRTVADVALALASWGMAYTLNRTWVSRAALQRHWDAGDDVAGRGGGGDDDGDDEHQRLVVLRDDGGVAGASADGRPKWVLEPDVERLVRFRGYDPRAVEPRSTCSDLAREIVGEQARFAALHLRFRNRANPHPHALAHAAAAAGAGAAHGALPEHVQRQVDAAHRRKARTPSDAEAAAAAAAAEQDPVAARGQGFLATFAAAARARETKRQQEKRANALTASQQHVHSLATKSTVTFRFQEGFTNAVRRPVFIQDFLN